MKHSSADTRPSKQLCRTTKHPYGGTGRIFGDGCANREYYAGTGFLANRRERTSGPDEGGGAAKQKDGVCPTTLDRAFCPDQKEEFAVQQPRRISPPFPDVSPKACDGRAEGPWYQPEGLWLQGRRTVATRHKACDGNAQGPWYQPEGLTGGQPTQNPLSSAVSGKLWQIFYSDRSCLRSFVFSGVIMNAVSLNGARR